MTYTQPKRGKLRKHVIYLLGKGEKCLEQNLKTEIKATYTNLPEAVLNSAIDTLLLELDESRIVKLEANHQITLTEVGQTEYRSIIAQQELKKRKRTQKSDMKQKEQEIERKKAASRYFHEELKLQLGELARLLGKTWKQEHELVRGGSMILDLIWYGKRYEISHAFEVQHRGDWRDAIYRLHAIGKRHRHCKLFVVAYDEKEIRRIQQQLMEALDTSTKVLRASQVQDWVSILGEVPKKFRPKVISTINSIAKNKVQDPTTVLSKLPQNLHSPVLVLGIINSGTGGASVGLS